MKLPPIWMAAVLAITTHLTTHSASARIGETLEQCIQRYGQPLEPPKPGETVTFKAAGMLIGIGFVNGKAGSMVFNKSIEDPRARLSDAEVSILMTANGGGQRWEILKTNDSLDTVWVTADHLMMADRQAVDGSLVIMTKEAHDQANANEASTALKKLSGF